MSVWCQWSGCPCIATHFPKIMVPGVGMSLDRYEPVGCLISLPLCLAHTKSFDVKEWFEMEDPKHGNHKEVFNVVTKGRAPPDFARAYVQPVSLDSEESRIFSQQIAQQLNGSNQSVPPSN